MSRHVGDIRDIRDIPRDCLINIALFLDDAADVVEFVGFVELAQNSTKYAIMLWTPLWRSWIDTDRDSRVSTGLAWALDCSDRTKEEDRHVLRLSIAKTILNHLASKTTIGKRLTLFEALAAMCVAIRADNASGLMAMICATRTENLHWDECGEGSDACTLASDPLKQVIRSSNVRLLRMLLTWKRKRAEGLVCYAAVEGDASTMSVLLDDGYDGHEWNDHALWMAARLGKACTVQVLLSESSRFEEDALCNAVVCAERKGHATIVEALIRAHDSTSRWFGRAKRSNGYGWRTLAHSLRT
jgi:hypothetical protein